MVFITVHPLTKTNNMILEHPQNIPINFQISQFYWYVWPNKDNLDHLLTYKAWQQKVGIIRFAICIVLHSEEHTGEW